MSKISKIKGVAFIACTDDGKPLHPDDRKAIEEFIEYRKKRSQKQNRKDHPTEYPLVDAVGRTHVATDEKEEK